MFSEFQSTPFPCSAISSIHAHVLTLVYLSLAVLLYGGVRLTEDLQSDSAQLCLVACNGGILEHPVACLSEHGLDFEFCSL